MKRKVCPICRDLFKSKRKAITCGKLFCKEHYKKWYKRRFMRKYQRKYYKKQEFNPALQEN